MGTSKVQNLKGMYESSSIGVVGWVLKPKNPLVGREGVCNGYFWSNTNNEHSHLCGGGGFICQSF